MKRFLSNLRKDIIWCIFVLAAAAALLYIAGFKLYIVRSGSMEPQIKTGSVVIVSAHQNIDDIKVGDVICFKASGDIIVSHRAISIKDEGIETKGDANSVSDGITVTNDNYIGKVAASIPYVGYMLAFIKKPQTIIILITIILMLTIISYLRKENKGIEGKIEAQNGQDNI